MNYLILALATWRISSMLTDELGPWDLLIKFRHLIGVRFDEHSETYGTNVIAEAFTCVWCMSFWIGLAWTVAFYYNPHSVRLALPFALSAGAIIIEEVVNGAK